MHLHISAASMFRICRYLFANLYYSLFRICQLTTAITPARHHLRGTFLWMFMISTLDEQLVGALGNSAVRPPPRSLREEALSTRDKKGRRDEI